MADRYEMLKQGIEEYKGVYGQEKGFSAVLELIEVLNKMADNEPENANNITREEIMAVKDDGERVKLISENYHLFNGGR